ncbi:MAG: hypothetical protein ACREJU_03005 [Nitrospiraceae bacterium]
MPRAKTSKQCYVCETGDLVRTSFLTCSRCQRYFCSEHGSLELDRCFDCLEAEEEVD